LIQKISMMFKSVHISVSINLPADQVYEFASNPENLPKWAAGLGGSIKNVNGDWFSLNLRREESKLNSLTKTNLAFWIIAIWRESL
jgi:hypothetical protein